MATRNINTFIQHLMNENLAATQAAVTAGTAVKEKENKSFAGGALDRMNRRLSDSIQRDADLEMSAFSMKPKIGDVVDIASPTQAAVTGGTAVKQKKREQRDDVLSSALGVGVGRIAVNPFTVDKLKKKSPAAAKEFTDSGNYGPKKAGVRDRMEKAAKSSGSMGGY